MSFTDFVAFLDAIAQGVSESAVRSTQLRFSYDLAQLETLRASSIFEDPATRMRSRRLFGYVGSFMIAASRLSLLHRQLLRLQDIADDAREGIARDLGGLCEALRVGGQVPASAREAQPVAMQIQTWLARTGESAGPGSVAASQARNTASTRMTAEGRAALATARLLLREAAEAIQSMAALYGDMHSVRHLGATLRHPAPRFVADGRQALLSGLRAALVALVTCAFWIGSAWPEGFSMTLLGVVGCALFSAAPNPTAAALAMGRGFVLAIPALFVAYCFVLPAADDFYLLALGLSPFLGVGAWLMTRPRYLLVGSGYFLMFLTGLNIEGVMRFDLAALMNNSLSLMLGMAVAGLSLTVIVPADRTWRPRRVLRLLLGSLRLTVGRSDPSIQPEFERRVRDLTMTLIALRPAGTTPYADESLGLAILAAGDAILRLRRCVSSRRELKSMLFDQALSRIDECVAAVERRDGSALTALADGFARLQAEMIAGQPASMAGEPDDVAPPGEHRAGPADVGQVGREAAGDGREDAAAANLRRPDPETQPFLVAVGVLRLAMVDLAQSLHAGELPDAA